MESRHFRLGDGGRSLTELELEIAVFLSTRCTL